MTCQYQNFPCRLRRSLPPAAIPAACGDPGHIKQPQK